MLLLAFNEILDVQPVALSEMPEMYLNSPRGRVLYMLKSFTMKRLDLYRNKVFKQIASSDPKVKSEGIRNLIKLGMAVVLMGSTADELKDLLLNRETNLSDRVVDNIFKLTGFGKFTIYKARQEGLWSAITKTALPPFKFLDALSKDIISAGDGKGLETIASIPFFGKILYWRYGKGFEKSEKKRRAKMKVKRPSLKK